MADITPVVLAEGVNTVAEVTPTITVGDTILVTDDRPIVVVVRNGGGVSTTVTIQAGPTPIQSPGAGLVTKANIVQAIAAGLSRTFLLDPIGAFKDPTSGKVDITCSAVTSVGLSVFKLP
jgi:hypothetical protein